MDITKKFHFRTLLEFFLLFFRAITDTLRITYMRYDTRDFFKNEKRMMYNFKATFYIAYADSDDANEKNHIFQTA